MTARSGCAPTDLVAYFCAEFGFHESLPIYSGGLGILAGDHCKAASDMRLPFVGVGLLYRQGYFFQTIDTEGNQQAAYTDSEFDDLPVAPVVRDDGSELQGARRAARARGNLQGVAARVGHVNLYLLDTDLRENDEHDRNITHQLYGGDRTTRIEQEIVLGVGGVRALERAGIQAHGLAHQRRTRRVPDAGAHARTDRQGLDFAAALEAVAANTVFTTHTPVPAGHDHFAEDMIWSYFAGPSAARSEIAREDLLALGRRSATARVQHDCARDPRLALPQRREPDPRRVSSRMLRRAVAADRSAGELRSTYITNGVHVPTFLAAGVDRPLRPLSGLRLEPAPDRPRLLAARSTTMPDHLFWSVRQSLKAQMLHLVRYRMRASTSATAAREAHLDRLLKLRRSGQPQRADDRLRPPLRHLQARHPALRESGLAARRSSATRRARCCCYSPARRTRPTGRGRT